MNRKIVNRFAIAAVIILCLGIIGTLALSSCDKSLLDMDAEVSDSLMTRASVDTLQIPDSAQVDVAVDGFKTEVGGTVVFGDHD